MLKAFAGVLNHPVLPFLENPFVKYVGNNPKDAKSHFFGLKEGVQNLKGIAIYDHIQYELQSGDLIEMMWERNEIENYIPLPIAIERYFFNKANDLFSPNDLSLIRNIIKDETPPAALSDRNHSFWITSKISDDYLDKIFRSFYNQKNTPVFLNKRNYYQLLKNVKPEEFNQEVKEKLDKIYEIVLKSNS